MAKGGRQPGAGRPKGSVTRPQIRDYFTEEEIRALIDNLKERAKQDNKVAMWLGDHILGKPQQSVDMTSGGKPILITANEEANP